MPDTWLTDLDDDRFLDWVAARLVHLHGDPESADFVLRLRRMAGAMRAPGVDPHEMADATLTHSMFVGPWPPGSIE